MNQIKIDLERTLGNIDRNVFGGFAEHVLRVIYGGIYDPDSPLADEDGLRSDVQVALRRLNFSNMRYPGGNFASGYRWMDGVGPRQERPSRRELAWSAIESNQFGTNEFIRFCRKLDMRPYLCANCGDGDMREAADWVEYCNGTGDTSLARLRRQHGFEDPHKVKYWSIGNEVDGPGQVGYKTAQEYARAVAEFGKVMKRVDPDIKLIAATVCRWADDIVERGQLILEHAGHLVDYLALHWYLANPKNDFRGYMTVSELFEERLSAYEGLIRAVRLERGIERPIAIAVDEWNVWKHAPSIDWFQNLEDALVIAMNLNAFIRHAKSVKIANLSQIVNRRSPILTRPDGLVLQTIFYPFELYSRTCGRQALDVLWSGETFAGTYVGRERAGAYETHREYTGVRVLDVTATLDEPRKQLVVYVVNRSQTEVMETMISLADGQFVGSVQASVVNGPDIKTENTFEKPNQVGIRETTLEASGKSLTYSFEPHSVTALVCAIS